MPQLLVRHVPPDLVQALKRRAAENGRSAEAEHRALLQQALDPPAAKEAVWEAMRLAREATRGRIRKPSEAIVREERDRRDAGR